jgi:hypothetical protein
MTRSDSPIAALAEAVELNRPLGVCDVERGPVAVREGVPDGVVAVDGDAIGDSPLVDGRADAVDVRLDGNSGVWTPRLAAVNGSELSHSVAPARDGRLLS